MAFCRALVQAHTTARWALRGPDKDPGNQRGRGGWRPAATEQRPWLRRSPWRGLQAAPSAHGAGPEDLGDGGTPAAGGKVGPPARRGSWRLSASSCRERPRRFCVSAASRPRGAAPSRSRVERVPAPQPEPGAQRPRCLGSAHAGWGGGCPGPARTLLRWRAPSHAGSAPPVGPLRPPWSRSLCSLAFTPPAAPMALCATNSGFRLLRPPGRAQGASWASGCQLLTTNPRVRDFFLRFMDENVEAQGGAATCPRPHSRSTGSGISAQPGEHNRPCRQASVEMSRGPASIPSPGLP